MRLRFPSLRSFVRRGFLCGGIGLLTFAGASADEPDKLSKDLSGPTFESRIQATQRLIAQGAGAVPDLQRTVLSDNPEAAARALRTLESLMTSDEGCEAAERVLLQIQDHGGPKGTRAAEILRTHFPQRSRRAKRALEELGARLLTEDDELQGAILRDLGVVPPAGNDLLTEPAEAADEVSVEPPEVQRVSRVVLDRNWKGGAEGLWHLRRIFDDRQCRVFWTEDCPVSRDDVYQVVSRLPHTDVALGNRAFLGVSGALGEHAIVDNVVPGSAAARSGLKSQDRIDAVDGHRIQSFHELMQEMSLRKSGSAVTLEVQRGNETIEAKVELGAREEIPVESHFARQQFRAFRKLQFNPGGNLELPAPQIPLDKK